MSLQRLVLVFALSTITLTVFSPHTAHAEKNCDVFHITGYLETGRPTSNGLITTGQVGKIVAVHALRDENGNYLRGSDGKVVPIIPFGTTVKIKGIKQKLVVEDTGGGLREKDMDVLVASIDEAYELTSDRKVCIVSKNK